MHAGRKILNLRCDRKISQQELARACEITPSALSKIEAGINSPRASILWRIARNLGVTVEYLIDETIPYPYTPHTYRQELLDGDADPSSKVEIEVTLEERSYLEALRACHPVTREIAYLLPEASEEMIRLIHFMLTHSKIENPDPGFLERFEDLLTSQQDRKKQKR